LFDGLPISREEQARAAGRRCCDVREGAFHLDAPDGSRRKFIELESSFATEAKQVLEAPMLTIGLARLGGGLVPVGGPGPLMTFGVEARVESDGPLIADDADRALPWVERDLDSQLGVGMFVGKDVVDDATAVDAHLDVDRRGDAALVGHVHGEQRATRGAGRQWIFRQWRVDSITTTPPHRVTAVLVHVARGWR